MKSLDRRLAGILAGRYTPDGLAIADAKDADMAIVTGSALKLAEHGAR